jgi:hypothetical protein
MSQFNFYKTSVSTHATSSWRFLDKKGKVTKEVKDYACFSPLTYDSIPIDVEKIVVFKELSGIPYDKNVIINWTKELTKLGFPCSINFTNTDAEFTLDLKDFRYKMQVSCALQLVRALYERGVAYAPEFYFSNIKENDDLEKRFSELQLAHGKASQQPYCNTNHMITYAYNFTKPIKQKVFLKRLEETKTGVYGTQTGLDILWRNK